MQRSGSRRNFRDEFHLERIIAECHVPLPYRRTDVQPDLVDKVQDVDPRYNVDKRAFEQRWQKPGDKVRFAAFRNELNGINVAYATRPTSRFVEDYNYMELATLNLSYEFGTAKLQRYGIKRLKAMFYMNDVFHVSNVKQERGIDYPFARNFSIGLQARF